MKRRAEKCAIFCPVALRGKKKVICVLTQTSIQKLPLKFARRCHGKYLSNDFLEKEQPHQKKVSWKQSRKKSQGTCCETFLLFFYNIYESFLLLQVIWIQVDNNVPTSTPAFIPLPPFPLLIKAPRFFGTEEYGLFVLFVQ